MILYNEYKATSFLKNYIYSFLNIKTDIEDESIYLYPDGADYLVYDGKNLQIISKKQIKQPYILTLKKGTKYFLVRWKPYSLYFLQNDSEFFHQTLKILEEMLQNTKTFLQKKKLIELFIIELCDEVQIEQKIVQACDIIFLKKGFIKVEDLAYSCQLHTRTLQRDFKKITGFSPKEYIDIIKLQHSISLLNIRINQYKIVKIDPYYDYSHFYKTFKKYLRLTPKELNNSKRASLKSLFDIGRI